MLKQFLKEGSNQEISRCLQQGGSYNASKELKVFRQRKGKDGLEATNMCKEDTHPRPNGTQCERKKQLPLESCSQKQCSQKTAMFYLRVRSGGSVLKRAEDIGNFTDNKPKPLLQYIHTMNVYLICNII